MLTTVVQRVESEPAGHLDGCEPSPRSSVAGQLAADAKSRAMRNASGHSAESALRPRHEMTLDVQYPEVELEVVLGESIVEVKAGGNSLTYHFLAGDDGGRSR